jgi:predicted nucleotidyltransferase
MQSKGQPQSGEARGSFDPQHCYLERKPDKLQTYVQMLEDALGCQARVVGVLEIGSYAKGEAVPSSDIDTRVLVTSPNAVSKQHSIRPV